jgi:hypothetical protein
VQANPKYIYKKKRQGGGLVLVGLGGLIQNKIESTSKKKNQNKIILIKIIDTIIHKLTN